MTASFGVRRAAALTVTAAFALTACGSESDPASTSSSAVSPTTHGADTGAAGSPSGMGSMGGKKPSAGGAAGNGGMAMGKPAACLPVPKLAQAPRRVVTMDAGAAAFLIRLGQQDRVVGTAAADFKTAFVGTPLEKQVDAVRVIDPGRGSTEAVLAATPDFVTGISPYELGGFNGTPTPKVLQDNKIGAYVACNNRPGEVTDLRQTETYIRDLATIFQVPAKGTELINELRDGLPAAPADVSSAPAVLALSTAPDGGQGINTNGGASLANGIIRIAGGRNVGASVPAPFARLSPEKVVQQDPKIIVAVTGFGGKQTPAQLVASIKASPILAGTTAVRTGRIVTVPQSIFTSPSVLNRTAVDTIAQAVAAAS